MNDNRSDLRKILDQWVEGVNGRALDDVGRLYRASAVLVPTFSGALLSTAEAIASYFVHITDEREGQVVVREETLLEQALAGDYQVISGIYDWHIRSDEEEKSFGARFTFVMDPGSEGPILHYH